MSVCNIFNTLNISGGTFLTFSQYTEDLTRELSNPQGYHISPSKFIALNINYNSFYNEDDKKPNNKYSGNKELPKMLQNEYENACAFFRDKYVDWTPNHARMLLINTLIEKGLLKLNTDSKNPELCEISYIGDINMVSSDTIDGLSYNELFCYIPNDAKKANYYINQTDKGEPIKYTDTYIKGYDSSDELPLSGQIYNTYYTYNTQYSIINAQLKNSESEFVFNTIIVLYNIYSINNNGDMTEIYTNIPMGIYFTGDVQEDGTLSNTVTKYVSSNEVFGSGTSYGLKICTRFTASTVGSKIVGINTSTESASTALVMSEMYKTLNSINKIIANNATNLELLKTSLAAFKNDRTNVPYIKNIDGHNYWFVNGRNIGILVNIDNYTYEEVDTGIDDFDKTLI